MEQETIQRVKHRIDKHPKLYAIEGERGPRLSEATRSRIRGEKARQTIEAEALRIGSLVREGRESGFRMAPDALCDLVSSLEHSTWVLGQAASELLSEVVRDAPPVEMKCIPGEVEWWERG